MYRLSLPKTMKIPAKQGLFRGRNYRKTILRRHFEDRTFSIECSTHLFRGFLAYEQFLEPCSASG